jgi:hypothetical protein
LNPEAAWQYQLPLGRLQLTGGSMSGQHESAGPFITLLEVP